MVKKRIAVLVSGGGTNLQALIDAAADGRLKSGVLALVVADREGAYALTRAERAGLRSETLLRRTETERAEFEFKLDALLHECEIDLIVLAGFLTILSKGFVSRWRDRIVNVHPSLIPAYCGRGFYGLRVHEAVLAAGETETGATVHMVNEIPDGGRVLLQKRVQVLPNDTPETLQGRVMREAEHILLPEAVERLCAGDGFTEGRMKTIGDLLSPISYVGRGIALGVCADGKTAALAYFLTGRSVNSRNRALFRDGDALKIRILEREKLSDASLILYTPLRVLTRRVIITNGDQTDTVYEGLSRGETFEKSLRSRAFEPDAPNFTPRISGLIELDAGGAYSLSILKAGDAEGQTCVRETFAFEPRAGEGRLIHTYMGDGAPLPSFSGEPRAFALADDIDGFASDIWSSLDRANRVSLYVRFTDIASGKYEDRLFNSAEENA